METQIILTNKTKLDIIRKLVRVAFRSASFQGLRVGEGQNAVSDKFSTTESKCNPQPVARVISSSFHQRTLKKPPSP
jgi:hypothetical protein